jgi:predicted RNA binding protein YcfA (HicA-like mRNA interferase family)
VLLIPADRARELLTGQAARSIIWPIVSNIEKLSERLLARPVEMRFDDVERILVEHGYSLKGSKGSHRRFEKPGRPMILVPVFHGHVKRAYLSRLVKLLEYEEGT